MFKSKEEVGFQVFILQYYLPLIKEMVDREIDLLYTEIKRNTPPIILSKEQTEFELTLLFLKTSGYGLSKIKGFDERFYGQLELIIDEYLSTNFAHIELNPKMLQGKRDISVSSDQYFYYGEKFKKYHEFEQLYQQDKIRKEDFPLIISGIFLAHSCRLEMINEPLAIAIGELHKGSLIYLYKSLSSMAKRYQIITDIE